jgi:hypothetical protein
VSSLSRRICFYGLSCVCAGLSARCLQLLVGAPLNFMWGVICWMSITCVVGASLLTAKAFGKEANV